eukprot:3210777-Rhodomonas_salina.6
MRLTVLNYCTVLPQNAYLLRDRAASHRPPQPGMLSSDAGPMCPVLSEHTGLRACYALSGTEKAYLSTSCQAYRTRVSC